MHARRKLHVPSITTFSASLYVLSQFQGQPRFGPGAYAILSSPFWYTKDTECCHDITCAAKSVVSSQSADFSIFSLVAILEEKAVLNRLFCRLHNRYSWHALGFGFGL